MPLSPGRICVVLNPAAGSWKRWKTGNTAEGRANLIKQWFTSLSPDEIGIIETSKEGGGMAAAVRAIEDGFSIIVAAGGDGTIREVISGIVNSCADVKFAVIPIGTANVFARCSGIPVDRPPIAAAIAAGQGERRIDLGECNGEIFVLHAGVGMDALSVALLDTRLKKRFGKAAYLIAAWIAAHRLPEYSFNICKPCGTAKGFSELFVGNSPQVFAANAPLYAGNYTLAPENAIDMCDGQLNIIVRPPCRSGRQALFTSLLHLMRGSVLATAAFTAQAPEFEINASPPATIQLDGDVVGTTPARIRTLRGALRMAVPGTELK